MRSVAPNGGAWVGVRWRIVGLLSLISLWNYFNRISMPVAGDRIMQLYPISEVQMGWVYSALVLAYAACMVPGGWLSDHLGGRVTLTAMGFGTAACCVLTGLAGWPGLAMGLVWPILLGVRAVMGAFTAPLYPAAGRVVSRWVPFPRRALANGLITGAAMLGMALAHPGFSLLMDAFGWQGAFVVAGAVTAALAVAWTLYGRDDPARHASVDPAQVEADAIPAEPVSPKDSRRVGSLQAVVRNRSLWLLTACYMTLGYVEYLVFYWSGHYFKQVLHFGEWQGQLAAMAPPLAMGVGMPLGGWLADRLMAPLGYRRARAAVALLGMIGCGTLLCAGTVVTHPVAIVACFTLALGASGLAEAAAWATAIDLGGDHGATSAAVANTGGNLGGFVSPVTTPWISAWLAPSLGPQLGWAWGLRLGGVICLIGAALWFWIDPAERAAEPGAQPSPHPELVGS
jgi:ACS family glucarate transporter-like MFS transporter